MDCKWCGKPNKEIPSGILNKNFGQRIYYDKKLFRLKTFKNARPYKLWKETPCKPSHHGVFVGVRTLQNGFVDRDDDGWSIFIPASTVRAALVVPSCTKAAIYVPLDSVIFYPV